MAPAPPPAITPRVNRVGVCVVPHCGGEVIESKHGKARSAEYAGRCESCCYEVRIAKAKRAHLRRHGVAA